MNQEIRSIEYKNSLKDVRAVAKYTYTRSKHARRIYLLFVVLFMLAQAIIILISPDRFLENPIKEIIILSMYIPILFVFMYLSARILAPLEAMIVYGLGSNKGSLGKHKITISSENLTEETAYNKTTIDWAAIVNVVKIKSHLLIYQNAIAAHVIPLRAFDSEADSKEFIEKVIHYHSTADLERT